jgi:hypothetical protein
MTAHPQAGTRRVTSALRRGPPALFLIGVMASCAAGEPPLPPEPGDAVAEVQPAAFDAVGAARVPAAGALPLAGKTTSDRPATAARSPLRPLGDWTVLAAIGAAFALVAAFRLTSLRRTQSLPPDVFELLGEASLGGQQTARVVRFGPRTLLIGVSSAGCQTLAELDDPHTTERISAACRSAIPAGRSAARSPRPHPVSRPAGRETT